MMTQFQSTHSLRSATKTTNKKGTQYEVSIHALLAECDIIKSVKLKPPTSFNPRTPCGVRRAGILSLVLFAEFQSTHSLRSATAHSTWEIVLHRVSIHALLAECDRAGSSGAPRTAAGFQSTHSLRSATQPTLYITTQQSKSYFAPTSLKRPSLHGYTF